MIRRNVTTADGQPAWLLISQVEHAWLSGEMAEHWSGNLPLIAREQLLPAIYHHDDGWADWEQAPDVDPQTGRPLAFTEMPLGVALEIWRKSIARAEQIGSLAAWAVASHFTVLLSHSHEAKEPLAVAWLGEHEQRRSAWLAAWIAANPATNTSPRAETALHQLQFFDRLSLWLCMAERSSAQEFATAGETMLTLAPQAGISDILVSPWPFTMSELELSVPGRLVPAQAYPDSAALAAVPVVRQTLQWRLTPR